MVFVTAEIGVNWDGNFELVEKMIKKSMDVGCQAVKFQAFNEETVKNHPEKKRLLKNSITEENIEKINEISKNVGIEWFCTPMYTGAVDMLEPFVKKFKIREYDSRDILKGEKNKVFEKVLETGKEVIISCNTSPKSSEFYNNPKIKWLYCVPKYPCKFNDLDFSNLDEYDGYSNHCPHFLAPLVSAVLGANIIEIHITSDKSKNFLDNNVSFDYDELKKSMNLLTDLKYIRI